MWATNVSGTFYVTRAATRHLLRAASEAGTPPPQLLPASPSGYGMQNGLFRRFRPLHSATVTSVGSIVGLDGNAGQTGYAATKAALVGAKP